jgi:hypothetical protein
MLVVVLLWPLSLAMNNAEAIARGQQQRWWLTTAAVVAAAAVLVVFDCSISIRQRPHNN